MSSQEREELYKAIKNVAEDLKGGLDGWNFKQYFLGFLFYKYISDDFTRYVKNVVNATEDFDYSQEEDDAFWLESLRDKLIEDKGYMIYPSQLFKNVEKRSRENPKLCEEIEEIFRKIEISACESTSQQNFKGLFGYIDFRSRNLGEEEHQKNLNISNILKGITELNLNLDEPDKFGDAYEYLIGMFASDAGKRGGEFFTPPQVSELLVGICIQNIKKKIRRVYDPTCGSGSLLLKFLKKYEDAEFIEFFGQDVNPTVYNLCRMNMFLHNVDCGRFRIELGCTLTKNKFLKNDEKTEPILFDAIVSNPPFSTAWPGKDDPELVVDPRFSRAGVLAPKNKADLAFIQHSVFHLDTDGVAAIVCFPGILQRAKGEKEIRKWLVYQNYVDAVIQLPEKLFYGVDITTCILVLKKSKETNDFVFIDASSFFIKEKNRNKLSEENIQNILQLYKERKDVEDLVKVANLQSIEEQDFNLSISSYLVKKTTKPEINIDELSASIKNRFEELNKLRAEIERVIKDLDS